MVIFAYWCADCELIVHIEQAPICPECSKRMSLEETTNWRTCDRCSKTKPDVMYIQDPFMYEQGVEWYALLCKKCHFDRAMEI